MTIILSVVRNIKDIMENNVMKLVNCTYHLPHFVITYDSKKLPFFNKAYAYISPVCKQEQLIVSFLAK